MTSKKDNKQKEIDIPMSGIEVMNELSLAPRKIFYLAQEGLLLPSYPKDSLWIKLQINSRCDAPENTLSLWTYRKSNVEEFKLKHKNFWEKLRQQKNPVLPESQKPSKPQSAYFSDIGKKGGEKSKKNQPILLAVTKYLRDNPTLANESNENIVRKFKRNVKGDESIIVDFDGCKWDIYYEDKYIWAVSDRSTNNKKSIAYSTFRNSYIPEAKKLIKNTQFT